MTDSADFGYAGRIDTVQQHTREIIKAYAIITVNRNRNRQLESLIVRAKHRQATHPNTRYKQAGQLA